MHDIDVLSMKAEFAKDEHGVIWFQSASSIMVRDTPGRKTVEP